MSIRFDPIKLSRSFQPMVQPLLSNSQVCKRVYLMTAQVVTEGRVPRVTSTRVTAAGLLSGLGTEEKEVAFNCRKMEATNQEFVL